MRFLKILLLIGAGYGLYELLKRLSTVDGALEAVGLSKASSKPAVKHSPTHHTRADAKPFGKPGLPVTGGNAGGGTGTTVVTEDPTGQSVSERVGRGVVHRGE